MTSRSGAWWALRVASAQCQDLAGGPPRLHAAGATEASYRDRAESLARWAHGATLALRTTEAEWSAYAAERDRLALVPDPAARQVLLTEAADRIAVRLRSLLPAGGGDWVRSPWWGHWVRQDDPATGAWGRLPRDADGSPAGPQAVAAWWAGLTPAQREALIVAFPSVIGGLAGLPARVRDRANRLALDRDTAAWSWRDEQGGLSAHDQRAWEVALALDQALGTGPHELIYTYDPDAFGGDGALGVFTADPGAAEHTAILVPGFTNDGDDIGDLLESAWAVDHAAEFIGDGQGEPGQPHEVAVLAWLGYDAPDNLLNDFDGWGVVDPDAAAAGAGQLTELVAGLSAGDQPPHLTVIGHSYGSTTASLAASGGGGAGSGMVVDDLVLVGSPGAGPGVDSVSDYLGVGQVWVGAGSRDPIAGLGDHGWVGPGTAGLGLGQDPADDAFGGIRFQAESVTRNPSQADPFAVADHSKYFDADSESLANIGAVVAGHPDAVITAAPVHDPWWGPPRDPEADREPHSVATGQ